MKTGTGADLVVIALILVVGHRFSGGSVDKRQREYWFMKQSSRSKSRRRTEKQVEAQKEMGRSPAVVFDLDQGVAVVLFDSNSL
ncbi:hypothetical protein L6452_32565 [Arctium lappa]|uniref:Uncharacterized protein n=1 Tax=Arctium lappa TaxID=4217 RepID=A0ACB8Z560_ARCLA|nr:hypothetical protein L6452_32565 [Arctium lappa]